MVSVTYYCPHCGAFTSIERDAYLADKCVTPQPLEGWEYASTTEEYEDADGIEFVCLGDDEQDGCGRTFYLSFVKFERGEEVEPRVPAYDGSPSFGFLR